MKNDWSMNICSYKIVYWKGMIINNKDGIIYHLYIL